MRGGGNLSVVNLYRTVDVSKSDKKHDVSRWSAINSAISQCDLWENLFWGKNRRGVLKRAREKWWKLLWSESESCSAFSSFPLEALEILSAIKGTKRKQLAGAVKVETICSSEEINRMGTEQNEKEGMDLLRDGNSPSVLGWDCVTRQISLALGKPTGTKQIYHLFFMGMRILLCTGGQEHQIWLPDSSLNRPQLAQNRFGCKGVMLNDAPKAEANLLYWYFSGTWDISS